MLNEFIKNALYELNIFTTSFQRHTLDKYKILCIGSMVLHMYNNYTLQLDQREKVVVIPSPQSIAMNKES